MIYFMDEYLAQINTLFYPRPYQQFGVALSTLCLRGTYLQFLQSSYSICVSGISQICAFQHTPTGTFYSSYFSVLKCCIHPKINRLVFYFFFQVRNRNSP